MKGKRIAVGAAILCLAVALTLGPGLAQEQEERTQPQGTLSIDAIVNNRFTYQGMLREDGAPVTGTRDMVFRLFSDAGCSTPAVTAHPAPDVEVNGGLFSVELPVPPMALNGQGLWLRVQVEGTTVACQEILPVPYAFSVRPGASIVGEQPGWEAIHAENTATTGGSYGIYAQSASPAGAGVLAKGVEGGADLILAGNSSSQDNGTIYSDPAYPSSDIVLVANDTIRLDLNHDGDGDDGDLEIYDHNNNLLFDVDDSGDVVFGGPGRAAFPRPAYDSGWRAIGQNRCQELHHNLGGDTDKYVVDLELNKDGAIHILGLGGNGDRGALWRDLTASTVDVCRLYADTYLDSYRLRIWLYP
jgi:hypothetical protein